MYDVEHQASDRRLFLRRAGVTLGAAIGAAVLPRAAFAIERNCCPVLQSQCPGTNCGDLNVFRCSCGGTAGYCTCASGTQCYTGPC